MKELDVYSTEEIKKYLEKRIKKDAEESDLQKLKLEKIKNLVENEKHKYFYFKKILFDKYNQITIVEITSTEEFDRIYSNNYEIGFCGDGNDTHISKKLYRYPNTTYIDAIIDYIPITEKQFNYFVELFITNENRLNNLFNELSSHN